MKQKVLENETKILIMKKESRKDLTKFAKDLDLQKMRETKIQNIIGKTAENKEMK